MRSHELKHLANGLCRTGCGGSLKSKLCCEKCLKKQNTEAKRRHKTIEGWAVNIAANQRRKGKKDLLAETIVAVWKQQKGRCAILDVPLELNVNVSVDHIIPYTKGGTSELANIRIIHTMINNAKHSMLDGEFAAMIRVLYPWACKVQRSEYDNEQDAYDVDDLDAMSDNVIAQ